MKHAWTRRVMLGEGWRGNQRAGDHFEDPGFDCRIILKWIFEKWKRGMDLIDWDRRRAVVSAVMNLRIA